MAKKSRTHWVVALGIALALVLGMASDAQAAPQILRPSTRPMFFTGGVGPVFWGLNARSSRWGGRGVYTRFKTGLDFGWHFSGDGEGPAIGASIEQEFIDFYFFNPAFKFWYDIEIADMAIYVAPLAKAGYALATCSRCPTGHYANIGIGVEGRVVLGDRGMVYLRPLQLDSFMGTRAFYADWFVLNYSAMLGGGVTF
ncbi:MAG: hypothetical protein JRI68_00440 [Deltaproteobacteria bacterium]|nr:hypothetical protein [Deltaproteobacteria bacterium]